MSIIKSENPFEKAPTILAIKVLVTVDTVLITSAEGLGNIDSIRLEISAPWRNTYALNNCFIIIGNKNHKGRITISKNIKTTNNAEKFGDLILRRKKLYTGRNENPKTNAKKIVSKIGLRIKKVRIIKIAMNPYIDTFLNDSSVIIF